MALWKGWGLLGPRERRWGLGRSSGEKRAFGWGGGVTPAWCVEGVHVQTCGQAEEATNCTERLGV